MRWFDYLLIAVVVGLAVYAYLATQTVVTSSDRPEIYSGGTKYDPTPLPFQKIVLPQPELSLPQITNVQIINWDDDAEGEILFCDSLQNSICLADRQTDGSWTEQILIKDVAVPAHVTVVDIDQDGDRDLLVAILGNIMPDDSVIGRVELFEQTETGFQRHILFNHIRRVADIQTGDFDNDGDLDLAVAEFGYSRGHVWWLENQGEFQFQEHELLSGPGTIHVPVGDFDNDGDLDITACVTQDEEEIWCFENLGEGNFQRHLLWHSLNLDLGSAGLMADDLDRDGDLDLILPAGDNLEDFDAYPQPYHGCYWMENQGNWQFQTHRISDLGGTYAAATADFDRDDDTDVVLVSLTNNYLQPKNASIVWLENDGQQKFSTWQIDHLPRHLVTVATGDLNTDGLPDIVAGCLNVRKPHRDLGRVTIWLNQGKQ